MADNTPLNTNTAAPGGTLVTVATDNISDVHHPYTKLEFGADGVATPVSASDPLPVALSGYVAVTGPLTNTQLRAAAVVVDGSGVTQPISAGSLPLPTGAATEFTLSSVDGEVSAINTKTPSLGQAVKAGSVPVTLASDQGALPVTGPLTDTQLRATAVPVSDGGGSLTVDGTVAVSGSVAVTGPLTDTQLRATAVPVSVAALPLPAGAATETTLASIDGKTPALVTGRVPVDGSGVTQPVLLPVHEAAFTPGYDGPSAATEELNVDPEGHLIMRGPVHTDEASFRVNFANSSLGISIGSPTRTGLVFSGGNLGSGLDLHVGDYVKFDADPESAWARVEGIDANTITVAAYTGSTTSGAASRALVKPVSGTGGSNAVASGKLTISSGTTASDVVGVSRFVDYAPLVSRASVQLSQRIANQDFVLGLQEDAAAPRWFARFRFTGTTNTQVICETGRNPTTAPSADETQSQTVYLPNGSTSATAHEFRIELMFERVVFYVDDVPVATNTITIPGPVDEMAYVARWVNTGTPANSSNAVVDYLASKNANKLEIGVMSDTEKLIAAIQPMKEFSFSQAGVIAINTDLLVLDCRQLAAVNIQCTSMGTTGVVTPQWSNDPAFSVIVGATVTTPAGADATTFNAAGIWSTPVVARYLRLRLTTATTAGTTTLAVNGSSFPVQTRLATQPVSGTVAVLAVIAGTGATNLGKAEDAAAASGDVGVFTLAVRRDALTTSASATGDYNEMACNRFGAQLVSDFRVNARSFRAAGNVTLATSATDFFDLPGNATTTVVVTRIAISGVATSASQADILVLKRSTANSSGTRVAMTAVPLDSTDSAASSVPGLYTANPTTGTLVGAVGRQHVGLLTASGAGEVGHEWTFGERGKGLVLSGAAQVLSLNLNGVTISGGVVDVEVDWYEF